MSHGGARAGAGRPNKADRRIQLSTTVNAATAAFFMDLFDDLRVSRSTAIDELVRAYGPQLRQTIATCEETRQRLWQLRNGLSES